MEGKYRKIMVEMRPEPEGAFFAANKTAKPICYVESYKEKRAVFFQCHNLSPREIYYLLLLGECDGQTVYKEFGPLHTSGNGALQHYGTFGGAKLDAYTFCILCAAVGERDMDIIYRGSLFPDKSLWEKFCQPEKKTNAFTPEYDETDAQWFRLESFDELPKDVQRCLPWMVKYGHYIIGRKGKRFFLGVPGRFLQKEQPLREEEIFLLWQPMRGGEAFFDSPESMTSSQQEEIFGYWIAETDEKSGQLKAL